jgi:hypothetical protein
VRLDRFRMTRLGVPPRRTHIAAAEASWRSGYAEDCKSLHPGSIPGEASNFSPQINPLHINAFAGIVTPAFAINGLFTG